MKTSRISIALMTLFILPTLLCCLAFADDTALKGLKTVRLTINTPTDSGYLYSRIRNLVELKLRQAGLNISDSASAELRLNIIWVDIDAREVKRNLGKYGTVQFLLIEPVVISRNGKFMTNACTWQGDTLYLHGPTDDFADRTKQLTADLIDDFLNRWLKAKE